MFKVSDIPTLLVVLSLLLRRQDNGGARAAQTICIFYLSNLVFN